MGLSPETIATLARIKARMDAPKAPAPIAVPKVPESAGTPSMPAGAPPVFGGQQAFRDKMSDFHDTADRISNAEVAAENPNDPAYLANLADIRAGTELAKLHYEDEHPWGSAENHPGFWGKFGHIAGQIGQAAGDFFAPGVMAVTPGTQLNRDIKEKSLEGQLERGRAAEQQQEKLDIEGGKEKPQTDEERTFDSLIAQGVAPIDAYRQVKTASKEPSDPKDAWFPVPGTNMEVNRATGDTRALEGVTLAGKTPQETPFQLWMHDPKKFADWMAANKKNTGLGAYAMVRLLTEAYRNDPRLLAVLPEIFKNMNIPLPPGIAGPPPGQPRDVGTGQPIGLAQPGAPTGTVRTRGQMAQDVLDRLPDIRQQVENLSDELGPVEGRWNEFVTGKIGAPNEKFAKLRDNLEYLAGAITRLHLNTETGLQPFMNMLSAGKMSPQNIKAALDTTEDWAKTYARTGAGNQPREAEKPSAKAAPKAKAPKAGQTIKWSDFAGQ